MVHMEFVLSAIQQLLQSVFLAFNPQRFGITFLDLLILVIVIFYAYEGYMVGFTIAFLDLTSFVLSFLLGLSLYDNVGKFLVEVLAMPLGFANATGFFLVAFLSEILINIFLRRIAMYLPRFSHESFINRVYEKIYHFLGILPGIASALLVLSFLLALVIALPTSSHLKKLVTESKLGGRLVMHTSSLESTLNNIFGEAIHDTLNVITIKPQSEEIVNLHFTVSSPTIDQQAEEAMLQLVNNERISRGLLPLKMDFNLRKLARDYAQDMLQRGYFSHYSPEGLSPFDRMRQYGIEFTTAGENLALAPSVQLAHQGLMKSPGHRANILSPHFQKVGIGVMDGGIYGKMFVQEFTD